MPARSPDREQPTGDDPEQQMYRVETSDGRHAGFSGSLSGAQGMAQESDDLAPDDAPHQVREVPAAEVHDDGRGTYPIVYTTEEGDV